MKTSKTMSTLERELLDPEFSALFDKHYEILSLSEDIRLLMIERRFTNRDVAEATGYSERFIQSIRSGEREQFKPDTLRRILDSLRKRSECTDKQIMQPGSTQAA